MRTAIFLSSLIVAESLGNTVVVHTPVLSVLLVAFIVADVIELFK